MGRIIAFDIGKKRTGIAVTDPLKIIATGLKTIDSNELWQFLEKYLKIEKIELMIVGYPKRLNNENSEGAQFVDKFIEKWIKTYPDIQYRLVDERFTSKIAFNSMIESGVKKMDRRNKAEIDVISATILLQDYLKNPV